MDCCRWYYSYWFFAFMLMVRQTMKWAALILITLGLYELVNNGSNSYSPQEGVIDGVAVTVAFFYAVRIATNPDNFRRVPTYLVTLVGSACLWVRIVLTHGFPDLDCRPPEQDIDHDYCTWNNHRWIIFYQSFFAFSGLILAVLWRIVMLQHPRLWRTWIDELPDDEMVKIANTGDILLTTSTGFIDQGIRFFTSSNFAHVAMILKKPLEAELDETRRAKRITRSLTRFTGNSNQSESESDAADWKALMDAYYVEESRDGLYVLETTASFLEEKMLNLSGVDEQKIRKIRAGFEKKLETKDLKDFETTLQGVFDATGRKGPEEEDRKASKVIEKILYPEGSCRCGNGGNQITPLEKWLEVQRQSSNGQIVLRTLVLDPRMTGSQKGNKSVFHTNVCKLIQELPLMNTITYEKQPRRSMLGSFLGWNTKYVRATDGMCSALVVEMLQELGVVENFFDVDNDSSCETLYEYISPIKCFIPTSKAYHRFAYGHDGKVCPSNFSPEALAHYTGKRGGAMSHFLPFTKTNGLGPQVLLVPEDTCGTEDTCGRGSDPLHIEVSPFVEDVSGAAAEPEDNFVLDISPESSLSEVPSVLH